ncbi:hypothetical protein niasHT_006637 [Heterodera trifolii]|uniref:Uncharacterized protein n=1 Tax=Heterodera trifolii TaxID=157864 RepID=A0ABD2M9V1_9BILA
MRNIAENEHSLAANYFGHLSADKQMNALSLFMLYPLHFMQNFLFHFTHSANLPSQLEQNVRHDEMTTMGTTRSKINGGKTTATPPTEKIEAVEQLENGRRADGHQNERGGRHNKNKHSQIGQKRHGHHGSQGIHHDQHHIHVTTPKMKIHPPSFRNGDEHIPNLHHRQNKVSAVFQS